MDLGDKETNSIKLKDGRKLAYGQYGDPAGHTIMHFNGFPGSRLEGRLIHENAKKAGVKIITSDRPGVGLSDYMKKRKFLDWPDDIEQLADHLGLDKFIVQGVSGGGPYALACAFKIPDRLKSAGVISGIAPLKLGTEGMMKSNIIAFKMARRLPWLFKYFLKKQIQSYHDIEGLKAGIMVGSKRYPPSDMAIFEKHGYIENLAASTIEGARQGYKGLVHDAKLYAKSWGFSLDNISDDVKTFFWYGSADTNVGSSTAMEMHRMVLNSEFTLYEGEGHLSVLETKYDEISSKLLLED